MKDQELKWIGRRYLLAHSTLGRGLLEARFWLRRMGWRFTMSRAPLLKRFVDLVISTTAIVLLSPLLLLVALLMKLEDGGPVFFPQRRVGLNGCEFYMLKIRSMCLDAEKRLEELLARNQHSEGVTFKMKEDPRVTRIGRWLRKFSLDELPQLYNVMRGQMSLVGPRPPLPREVALYTASDRRRLAAKPGITCIWQISGRSNISFSGQVLLDIHYIESQSFWVDIKILAQTVPAVLSGKGAC